MYGAGGYFEFTGFPDLKPRDLPAGDEQALAATPVRAAGGQPIVDVTMRMQEGKQYFVNRITFTGNSTTRDNVIRREVRLYEGGVFNTEALKFTVKRLNQLGYFKQLEGDAIKVDKTPNAEGRVDVTLKLEEQNRNQLTFGAGVSQYEGFFGQLAFQTSNFLGRGETFSVGIQAGSRAQNYQLAFTEPFLFDRPITGGIDLYKREVRYISQFTQGSIGGNIVFGFPVRDFTRGFVNYCVRKRDGVRISTRSTTTPSSSPTTPTWPMRCCSATTGDARSARSSPSLVHNTVDNPIFPTAGRRLTLSMDFAGLGGNVNFLKPRLEGVWYFQQTRRLSLGVRGQFEYIRPLGSTEVIPIFERLFLGGEYSVRGFDIRSIGPRDPRTGLVLGGNKSLLFNAEYLIQIAGPVRLVLFYDAGQVPRFRLDTEGENDLHLRAVPVVRVQDVDRRGGAVLHACAERALPPHLRREPAAGRRAQQQPGAAEGFHLPVRRRNDLLTALLTKPVHRSKGHRRMRPSVVAAVLTVTLAVPGLALATPQAAPAAPAQTPQAQAPPATQPAAAAQPARPFPEGAKIAFINTQRIANESGDGKAATAKIRALNDKKVQDLNDKQKQLQAAQQKLQSGASVLSEVARGQLEKDIEKMNVDIQRFTQDAQAEVQELTQQLQADFERKLRPVIAAVAQERNLYLVLGPESGIIWADGGLDITPDVIKRFDQASGGAGTPK